MSKNTVTVHESFDIFLDKKRIGFIHQETKDDWCLSLDDMKYTLENELDNLKDFVYNRYSGQKVTIQSV